MLRSSSSSSSDKGADKAPLAATCRAIYRENVVSTMTSFPVDVFKEEHMERIETNKVRNCLCSVVCIFCSAYVSLHGPSHRQGPQVPQQDHWPSWYGGLSPGVPHSGVWRQEQQQLKKIGSTLLEIKYRQYFGSILHSFTVSEPHLHILKADCLPTKKARRFSGHTFHAAEPLLRKNACSKNVSLTG